MYCAKTFKSLCTREMSRPATITIEAKKKKDIVAVVCPNAEDLFVLVIFHDLFCLAVIVFFHSEVVIQFPHFRVVASFLL